MVLVTPKNKHVLKSFDLSGKVAAVTGGSRGIGLEVVRGLAEAGANVALIYSTTPDAEAKAYEIASENKVTCRAYRSNVTDQKVIEATIKRVAKDFGRLDILVANAGIGAHYAAEDCTPEEFRTMMKVNLDGAFFTAQAAARIFKEQGHGNILFTASVSALLVNVPQKQAAYNASKAGLVQLARSLAVEWVDFCRVNCISPGFIETDMLGMHSEETRARWREMVPAGRNCEAYELKAAYVFCVSDASSYMVGENLVIDGGYVLP